MNIQRLWLSLVCLVGFTPALRAAENARGVIPITYVEAGPTLDGQLNDSCWAKAKELTGFVSLDDGKTKPKNQTFVRGVYDQQKLYLSFRCLQPETKAPATQPRDSALWFDDCIELFLSPHITSTLMQTRSPDDQHFHLIVNSAGDQFDELGSAGPASWDGEWQCKSSVTSEGWQVEIAIPFASLYFENFESRKNPPEMTVWRVQFGRSTASDGYHSTLFPTKGMFKMHSGFGDLVFVSDPNDKAIRWKLDEQGVVKPRLAKLERSMQQMKGAEDAALRGRLATLDQTLTTFRNDFAKLKSTEYPASSRDAMFARLDRLEKSVLDVQANAVQQKATRLGAKLAVGSHPAIRDDLRVFPDSVPALDQIGKPVEVVVTPGEFEAASIIIWNEKPVDDLIVEVGVLSGESGTLPPGDVDVRWVKCWYQANDSDIVPLGRFLIPELLLKNPAMVEVDREQEKNILLDGYNGDPTARGYRDDSPTLLPIKRLPARNSTQAWLTVRVPPGTPAGVYRGTITVKSGNGEVANLAMQVRVLDFALSRSMLENNWYAQTMWGDRKWITEERALVEMKNLVDHGVDYVGLFERRKNLPEVFRLMKKAGMATDKVYLTGDGGDSSVSLQYSTSESVTEMAREWISVAEGAGCKSVYLYLIDEARDEVLRAEKPFAEAIQRAGAKTWVACYSNYFDTAGDVIDLANIANGPVAPELVAKIHAAGKRVFSYANPQGGVERPETYRRNYGLLLWQHDYDGSFDWSWYWQFGPDKDPNGWDDFNHRVYRDHMMVYATRSGVIDTIQWEGWREGVDDTRYVATLKREIEAARQRGQTKVADESANFLQQLKSGGSSALVDLDAVRAELIQHILSCRAAR
jgi:hypothetical protein